MRPNLHRTDATTVLDNIRAEGARRRLGQAELADLAGLTKYQLRRRMLGQAHLTVADLLALADAMELDPADLLAPHTVNYQPLLATREDRAR